MRSCGLEIHRSRWSHFGANALFYYVARSHSVVYAQWLPSHVFNDMFLLRYVLSPFFLSAPAYLAWSKKSPQKLLIRVDLSASRTITYHVVIQAVSFTHHLRCSASSTSLLSDCPFVLFVLPFSRIIVRYVSLLFPSALAYLAQSIKRAQKLLIRVDLSASRNIPCRNLSGIIHPPPTLCFRSVSSFRPSLLFFFASLLTSLSKAFAVSCCRSSVVCRYRRCVPSLAASRSAVSTAPNASACVPGDAS